MCSGVILNAGIAQVYAGCGNERFGGCGSVAVAHIDFSPPDLQKAQNNLPHVAKITATHPRSDAWNYEQPLLTTWSQQSQQQREQLQPHLVQKEDEAKQLDYSQQFMYQQGCMKDHAIKSLQIFYLRGNVNAPADKRHRQLKEDIEIPDIQGAVLATK